ncbi:hypothetical protein [Actinomadura formosensis]|uniref:hypothetical protein n=1 Tax=Actinomadura formosensis TaxID=60706 RepID=UPI003D901D8F
MTTAVFARAGAMADQVREEARRLDPVKALMTVLLVLPFLLGWVAGAVVRAVWAVLATVWAALAVGFRTALGREDEPG